MFNRQNENGDSAVATGAGEPGVTTMDAPLGSAGESAPGAGDTMSAVRKTRMSGTLVLLLVVVVAATSIFAMRRIGVAARIKMPDITIDYPVEKADLSVITEDHERMIEELRSSEQLVQVPLEQVQMNPFALRIASNIPTTTKSTGPSAADRESARLAAEQQKRVAELQSKHKAMKLNSVMGSGSVPVARISGQLVRVGDLVQEFFIVAKIDGRRVVLMADGQEFVLTLGEP